MAVEGEARTVKYTVLADAGDARRGQDGVPEAAPHWVRMGDQLLLWGEAAEWDAEVDEATRDVLGIDRDALRLAEGPLHLVCQVGRAFQDEHPDVRTVVEKGRYVIVELSDEELAGLAADEHGCWQVGPIPIDTAVFEYLAPIERDSIDWVQETVDAVSESSFSSYLTSLTQYSTRHSLSAEFCSAANWALAELRGFGYKAELVPINIGPDSSFNVVAERAGVSDGDRELVLVVAHLDSTNIFGGTAAPAPGADDNASGSAAALEIARVLASRTWRHDLRVILFGGEEQGLHGSDGYVSALSASDRERVRAVINMDMVGTQNTPSPTVLLEGAAVSEALMTALAGAAATYTSLTVQQSFSPFASDHVPFIEAMMPAVLTIEGTDSANSNVHTAANTIDHIHVPLALDIVKMNVAVLAGSLGTDRHMWTRLARRETDGLGIFDRRHVVGRLLVGPSTSGWQDPAGVNGGPAECRGRRSPSPTLRRR